MEKYLRIVLILVGLGLVATQYQNCSNTSDGAFWDNSSTGAVAVTQLETASITSSSNYIVIPQDYFEIQGVCNPGVGQKGILTYQIFASNNLSSPIGPSSFYSTANCDSGRFTFLVPIVPHQTCGSTTSCRFVIRAKMQIASKQIDLPEYAFMVANF